MHSGVNFEIRTIVRPLERAGNVWREPRRHQVQPHLVRRAHTALIRVLLKVSDIQGARGAQSCSPEPQPRVDLWNERRSEVALGLTGFVKDVAIHADT
jgi:hypothetical protein